MKQSNKIIQKITSPILSGLKGPERDLMITQLLSSEPLIKRINEVVEEEIKSLGTITAEEFDSPSWAFKQAYKLGLQEGLRKLTKLLKIS